MEPDNGAFNPGESGLQQTPTQDTEHSESTRSDAKRWKRALDP